MMSDHVTSTIVNQIGVIGYWGIVMSVIVTGVHWTGGRGWGQPPESSVFMVIVDVVLDSE